MSIEFRLASSHTAPPDNFIVDGMSNLTSWYVGKAFAGNLDAAVHLAFANIAPHYLLDNPDHRLCGSTWEAQPDGGFIEVASGTPEQIAAALAAQKHLRLRKEVWPEQYRQRRIREANTILNDPASTAMQRTEALQTLNTL